MPALLPEVLRLMAFTTIQTKMASRALRSTRAWLPRIATYASPTLARQRAQLSAQAMVTGDNEDDSRGRGMPFRRTRAFLAASTSMSQEDATS